MSLRDSLGFFERRGVISLAGPAAQRRVQHKDGPRFVTGVHEAGHAVVAHAFGIGIKRIDPTPRTFADGSRIGGVTILATGSERENDSTRPPGDLRMAVLAAAWSLPDNAGWRAIRSRVRHLRAIAEENVERNWPAVLALAGELMWGELEEAAIDKILDRFDPEKGE